MIYSVKPEYLSVCTEHLKKEILRNWKSDRITDIYLEISYIDQFMRSALISNISSFLPENFFDTNCVRLYLLSVKDDEKLQIVIYFGDKRKATDFENFYCKLHWVESLSFMIEMPPKVTNLEALKNYWN